MGGFEGFEGFESSGFVGVGDAMAVAEIRHYLKQISGTDPQVVYDDNVKGDSLKRTLILLGGPDANDVTRDAAKLINSKLRFGDPSINEIVIRDTAVAPPRLYAPSVLDEEGAGIDYGLILRAPNPFSPDKEILIIAGSFGYGTWAATRYVISSEFLALPMSQDGGALECLVETDVVSKTPQAIRLLVARGIRVFGSR